MIDQINLINFKGFPTLELRPKQITVFVGPNGSGKSSVLQAFALLKQTIEYPRKAPKINIDGPLIALAGIDELHAKFESGNADFATATQLIPPTTKEKFATDPKAATLFHFTTDEKNPNLDGKAAGLFYFAMTEGAFHSLDNNSDSAHSFLEDLKIVPALRGFTQPQQVLLKRPAPDLTLQENLYQREAQSLSNLAYCDEQTERVSDLLEKVTGCRLKAKPVPTQSIELMTISPVGKINILSEGFGTNSLIMLFQQLTAAPPNATVLIEEPEIHLNPKAQANLSEVLVDEAKAHKKQVIMTTHSEYIVTRLLTTVAEKKLTPEQLAIYAFAKDPATGHCSAEPLEVSATGSLRGGVRDFFDTNLEEMNRYVKAQFAQINAAE